MRLRLADGTEQFFPAHLQDVLVNTLEVLAGSGEVFISKTFDELTRLAAADTLGVCRMTLLKWVV